MKTNCKTSALTQAKESGEFDGEDGGYYIPNVDMYGTNTMTVGFVGSKDDMGVKQFHVQLPIPTKTETWTFKLEDGSTVTKQVYVV